MESIADKNVFSTVDVTGLMYPVRSEARRVMAEHAGDFVAEHQAILERLLADGLITGDELETLLTMYKLGYEAGEPKGDPQRAFFEVRELHARLAAGTKPSPVALVVASANVAAFEITTDETGTMTVQIARVSHTASLSAIGAGIGGLLGGFGGAALGGAIGGYIGGILDDKGSKK